MPNAAQNARREIGPFPAGLLANMERVRALSIGRAKAPGTRQVPCAAHRGRIPITTVDHCDGQDKKTVIGRGLGDAKRQPDISAKFGARSYLFVSSAPARAPQGRPAAPLQHLKRIGRFGPPASVDIITTCPCNHCDAKRVG
jgi:hypothetical protein